MGKNLIFGVVKAAVQLLFPEAAMASTVIGWVGCLIGAYVFKMKYIERIFLVLAFYGVFVIKFLPITLTLISIFIVKMIITADEIEKNSSDKNGIKYFFVIIIYLLLFLLIYFYMKLNDLPMGEIRVF